MLIIIITCTLIGPSRLELFPFGVSAGDFPGPTGDDSVSSPIILGVPLTFFGTEYSRIFVRMCTCGMVG